MPDDIYRQIMEQLAGKGVYIAVDATKDLLLNVLELHPFLIKPNNHELGEIFGVELQDRASVVPYAKKLQEKGAVNVLVSMAEKGAVLLAEDGHIYEAEVPKGTLVNGVGAEIPWWPDFWPDVWKAAVMHMLFVWDWLQAVQAPFPNVWQQKKRLKTSIAPAKSGGNNHEDYRVTG